MAVTLNDVDEVVVDGQTVTTPVVRDITVESNLATIRGQARTALTGNRTFLALAAPSNAQAVAQVQALSRQMNGLIRLLLDELDGTD